MGKVSEKKRKRPGGRTDTAAVMQELIQGCAQHGTAVDGMTKEEVIAHMRRVRERLWEAKHAYRPGRQ